ncbi:Na/Pi-cotransporter II-related protein [Desulfurispirillum indicum S5]|uniref:Na/Pi-cotransporter II-related protein n=1 Tax=Desulfurispirillum indicum (strain ATCC BAA-1389 / DSM 22839 / S5) TaxID=653733 RepID=E6W7C0_DESIS|nr:Na/Pi-cotransporter II-related protein [Desulfurispirillum indicum S5]
MVPLQPLDYINLLSGLMLLLYGISQVSANMQIIAGARLRTYLSTLTRNRLTGIITGTFATALLQSSSATTVITVTLVGSGLISFTASLGVLLGANIGTTLTVQLISFSLQDYALFMTGVGAGIRFFGKKDRTIYFGRLILGFGLIFLGMKFMGASVDPLRHNAQFLSYFVEGGVPKIFLVLGAFLFTAMVQASAATIALTLSFAASGLIDFHSAMYIVVGSNIGTGVTALLASFGSNLQARKTALANIIFNTLGALAIIPFLPYIHANFFTEGDIARNIANFHTLFNIALTIVFFPLIGLVAAMIDRLIKPRKVTTAPAEYFLDRSLQSSPDLAIQEARKLTINMTGMCREMLTSSFALIDRYEIDRSWKIQNMDDRLDAMNLDIRLYLTSLSHREMNPAESNLLFDTINYATTLEYVGDVLVKNVIKLSRKLNREKIRLSEEGYRELQELEAMTLENFDLCHQLYLTSQRSLHVQLQDNHQKVRKKENQLMQSHIQRLQQGLQASVATTTVHTDLVANLERINSHLCRFEPLTMVDDKAAEEA